MPLPDAVVAVVTHGRLILLIRRAAGGPDAGYWAPPSGKIEPGEGQEAAVVREVREEVGLPVRPLRKVWESVSASGTHTLHWWLATTDRLELTLDPRAASDARWLRADEIEGLEPTFDGDRHFFARVFRKE